MGRITRCLLALIAVLCCTATPGAQARTAAFAPAAAGSPGPAGFEHISVAQGLSQGSVNCILQDLQGFMWFGTEDGLNRYDGYGFAVYRHDPHDPNSLSHNRVRALYEDADGILWIGTAGGGLDRFDRDTGRFTHYGSDDFANYVSDSPVLYRNWVEQIREYPPGILWLGTLGGGLVRFDRATGEFKSLISRGVPGEISNNWILSLFVDHSGTVWIGTDKGGLNRLDPATGRFTYYVHDPADPASLSSNQVSAIYEDRAGRLWIGTASGGLDQPDRETGVFHHYRNDPADPLSLSNNAVAAIGEDRTGALWIGTYDGLNRLDPATGQAVRYKNDPRLLASLSNNSVQSIYEDASGILWVGTAGGGVDRAAAAPRFPHYQAIPGDANSLSSDVVISIYADPDGTLWIGTGDGGLDRLDATRKHWTHFRHAAGHPGSSLHDYVTALFADSRGVLWVGTGDGLDQFDRLAGTFVHLVHTPPDPTGNILDAISAIQEDPSGTIWIAAHGRGLTAYDPETGRPSYHLTSADPHSISSNFTEVLYVDRSGTLWAGTQGGLDYYDRATGQWHAYLHDPADPDSLSDDNVAAMGEDASGRLWIGTAAGLDQLDRQSGHFTHWGRAQGLPSDGVLGILADEQGNLWLTTAQGLSRFDPERGTFRNYDTRDGLQSGVFNRGARARSAQGEMFFGGSNGFNAFFPDRVQDNTSVPPIVLTSLTRNGEPLSAASPERLRAVTLRWPANSFEFEFAALSYVQPERNRYAYMLEGFDQTWYDAGTLRSGRYTNLPGGTYTLRMKGSNNDGVWNQTGASLTINIVPPPWETWWFQAGVLVLLAGAAYGAYRLRVRGIEARSRELAGLVAQRTAELQAATDQRLQAEQALRQSEMEKAVGAERSRLARELHDSVTQALYGIALYAQAATAQLSSANAERAAEHVRQLQDTAQTALAEMRLLIFELRPPVLAEEGLAAALHMRLLSVEGRAGLQTEFTATLEGRLPPEVEEGLYRIAQEALNNALRHAHAGRVTLALRQEGNTVSLDIGDDGVGFDPAAAAQQGGLGLAMMSERAARLGARLTIDSRPDAGTQIHVELDR